MSSKRMLVAMALLATLIAPLGFAADSKTPKAKKSEATAKTAEKAPRLTIVQPVKDFGTVAKGEKLACRSWRPNRAAAARSPISTKSSSREPPGR